MGRRKRKYTDEQRAQVKAADADIRRKGRELLTDPATVTAMVEHLLTTTSPKLLRYSVRNCAMLTTQADERGMTLTDVDSFKGWLNRGRCVRKGERGLRIVAPRGMESAEDNAQNDEAATNDDTPDGEIDGEGNSDELSVKYRMTTVFDINQTDDGGEDTATTDDSEVITDAAEVLSASLVEQIERLGYNVITTTAVTAAEIDDDRLAVIVPESSQVIELARALAALVTRPKEDRPKVTHTARKTEPSADDTASTDPAAARRIRLELDEDYGTAAVTVRTDWETARTFYTVKARNVTGAFTVHIHSAAKHPDRIYGLNVDYGEDNGRYRFDSEDRPHRPVVNGVELVRGTHGIDPDCVNTLDGRRIHAQRSTGRNTSISAPAKTCHRTAIVVRAILRHYLARPDLADVHRVATRLAAAALKKEALADAHRVDKRLSELMDERNEHTRRAEQLADLAEDTNQPALFPAS